MSASGGSDEDPELYIATLIAAGRLARGVISAAVDALAAAGAEPADWQWVEEGIAADIGFLHQPQAARAALEGIDPGIDVVVQPAAGRAKALLVADMDSTMITVECIDELADYAGIKAEVAVVTERAMRGELDFEAALDARVGLLCGLDAGVIDRCYAERVRVMAGARELIGTMRAKGARTVLVSGGFTVFADRVAAAIGFDRAVSNTLDISGGRLAGTVARPIVGAAAKRDTLIAERDALQLPAAATMAVGDGANDIPMIETAGLGVAYHAKPRTAAAAAARIDACDLTALLYAQGYARRDWAV
jgi:phosphoserine phosphatase